MNRVVYAVLIAAACCFLYCTRNHASLPSTSTYLNLAPDVQYVGMKTCKSCHANVHATFIHTGMGRSFDIASPEKSAAEYGNHALVYDTASNFYYKPFFRDSQMYILEFRLQEGDTVHQRLETVDYIVGSGQHTNSHIIDINGYIYQAPITYYTQEGRWDMAPGFRGDNIRFSRLLATECITCHNHFPEHQEGSMNKYSGMPSGIECERCHGPGEIHVKERLSGTTVDTSQFIDYTIVNPRDLDRDLQMDLCQRCHLQGIAVLNEGKDFFDFRPGMRLEEVFNVFLPRYTNSDERFIMASQADRLRLSPCYIESDMTCITCHNPHKSIEATGRDQYNKACQNCHSGSGEIICSAPEADRLAAGDDCSGCHMPRSGSIDIPHVNITDHYISKENVRGKARVGVAQGTPQFLGLKILTKEEGSPLEMARGYIAMFDKYADAPIMLDSAWHYLQQAPDNDAAFKTRIHYFFARNNYSEIIALAGEKPQESIDDGWTNYRIGEALDKEGQPALALPYYQKAVERMPYHLDFQEKLGGVYIKLKQLDKAIETLNWVLEEHPRRPVALTNLGFAHALLGNLPQALELYEQAITLDPDYEQALLNKAAIKMYQRDMAEARALIERILKINPDNAQARAAARQLQ
jgi:hypothetical protein